MAAQTRSDRILKSMLEDKTMRDDLQSFLVENEAERAKGMDLIQRGKDLVRQGEDQVEKSDEAKNTANLDIDALDYRRKRKTQFHVNVDDEDFSETLDFEEVLAPFVPETKLRESSSSRHTTAPRKPHPARATAPKEQSAPAITTTPQDFIDLTNSPPPPQSVTTGGGNRTSNFDINNPKNFEHLPWATTIVYNSSTGSGSNCGAISVTETHGMTTVPLQGPWAFRNHLAATHLKPPYNIEETIQLCEYRLVLEEEARRIADDREGGMPYVEAIRVASQNDIATAQVSDDTGSTKWTFGKNPQNWIPHISCVVKHPNGDWYELACSECHGNSPPGPNGYLGGPKAFWDHLRHAHKEDPMPGGPEALIERCKVRKFTAEEIRKIKAKEAGAPTIAPIATRNFPSSQATTNKRKGNVRTELERLNDELTPGDEVRAKRPRPNCNYLENRDEDDEEELPSGKVKVEVKVEGD